MNTTQITRQQLAEMNTGVDGIYWVPVESLPPLKTKINRLQRRATKCASSPITFTITDELVTLFVREFRGTQIFQDFCKVVVRGEPPKYNGWKLVARLLHPAQSGAETGNIINNVPGEDCPKSYRTVSSGCAHCGKGWIYRRDTYIVKSEAGEYKQVGSNCIADFLGHQNPEQVAAQFSLWTDIAESFGFNPEDDDFDDYEGSFRRGVTLVSTSRVLELVAAHHRVYGWTTKAQAEKDESKRPSLYGVLTALFPRTKEDHAFAATIVPDDADKELAGKALEWIASIDPQTDDTYLYNLRTLCASTTVGTRTIGQVCSVISAYRRAMGQIQARKHASETTAHIGTVGEKITTDVTVVSVRSFEGQFGPRHMNRFADEDGNTLIWWTGTRTFDEGEAVRIAGTVKKHGEYKGYKQTELTRVKELPNDSQSAILASLSPAAETILARAVNGHAIFDAAEYDVPADEYDAAISQLSDHGWIAEDEKGKLWTVDDATARLAAFAKPRKSKAGAKADKAAKASAKAAQVAKLASLSADAKAWLATMSPEGRTDQTTTDTVRHEIGQAGIGAYYCGIEVHGASGKVWKEYQKLVTAAK